MEHIHNTENDLPSPTAKQLERSSLESAVAHFLESGGCVTQVGQSKPTPVIGNQRTDQQLVEDLQLKAMLGQAIASAARDLGEPLSRCQRLARAYRIQFRIVSTSKSRRAL